MKVGIMSDYTVGDYRGGTEYYSDFLTTAANDYELDSVRISRHSNVIQEASKCDFIIMLNIRNFKKPEVDWVVENIPYCKIEMDYGFCEMGNGLCNHCKKLEDKKCFSIFYQDYKVILENAKFIVFLNPHQREFYRRFYGDLVNNSIVAMSFYDYPEKFVDKKQFRIPNSVFYTGRFFIEKGLDALVNFATDNPNLNVFVLGFGNPAYVEKMKNVRNIIFLGTRPEKREQIIDYMNLFEYFFSQPLWEDTGPISVVEAELCGMKLLINDNNKIRTNGWKDAKECRKMINEARTRIFEKVKKYGN